MSGERGHREALVKQQATFEKRVKGQPDAKALTALLAEAQQVRAAHEAAQKAFAAAVKAERAAGDAVTKFDRDLDAARRECVAQRDPLVSAGLEPPHIEGPLVDAWDGLVAWAAAAIPQHQELSERQTVAARAARRGAHGVARRAA